MLWYSRLAVLNNSAIPWHELATFSLPICFFRKTSINLRLTFKAYNMKNLNVACRWVSFFEILHTTLLHRNVYNDSDFCNLDFLLEMFQWQISYHLPLEELNDVFNLSVDCIYTCHTRRRVCLFFLTLVSPINFFSNAFVFSEEQPCTLDEAGSLSISERVREVTILSLPACYRCTAARSTFLINTNGMEWLICILGGHRQPSEPPEDLSSNQPYATFLNYAGWRRLRLRRPYKEIY